MRFSVGDRVLVRRNGNDRWIHHIGMDQIFERPGGAPGETSQWSPFSLDFDRIITGIDGDMLTFDAPLANAVERRWGGGMVIKYDDPDRIEHVGIENLRVEVEFDPAVTATRSGQTYFADENHAVRFAVLDNVKNAWVRDVTTRHLEHSLGERPARREMGDRAGQLRDRHGEPDRRRPPIQLRARRTTDAGAALPCRDRPARVRRRQPRARPECVPRLRFDQRVRNERAAPSLVGRRSLRQCQGGHRHSGSRLARLRPRLGRRELRRLEHGRRSGRAAAADRAELCDRPHSGGR